MHKFVLNQGLAVGLLTCLILVGCSDDDTGPVDPPPTVVEAGFRVAELGIDNSIRAMAANDTMVVAVGDAGIVYSTSNGHDWTRQREGSPNDALIDITWTGTEFIAVGFSGTLLRSPDGITWTFFGPGTQSHLNGVAASDTLMVAVGSGGMMFSSTDGDIWDSLASFGSITFNDIVYADEMWVACASGGKIFRSIDGLNWEAQVSVFLPTLTFSAITRTDSLFFVAAIDISSGSANRCSIYSSPDGDAWFVREALPAWYLHDIFWTGNEIITVGEGTNYHLGFPDGLLFSSTDGEVWTSHPVDAPFTLYAAGQIGTELIVAGGDGYILSGTSPQAMQIRASRAFMAGVIWDGTRFVAVTQRGTVMFSNDGDLWEEYHSSVATRFQRLAYSGDRYATLGGLGEANTVYMSDDGRTWLEAISSGSDFLTDINYANNKLLACGENGIIFIGGDIVGAWGFVGDSVTLTSVLWDGSRYLASSIDQVYTSDDGGTWINLTDTVSTENLPTISRMIWTGEQYVAVGNLMLPQAGLGGYVSTSPDAVIWTRHDLGQMPLLYDIAFDGTDYIICGRGGQLLTSKNAVDWEVVESLTENDLLDIAVGDGKIVIVGEKRTVLIKP